MDCPFRFGLSPVFLLLIFCVFALGACQKEVIGSDDDDADDDTDDWGSGGGGWLDNPEIAEVVQEVIEGLMARDAEALEEKVYLNLDDDFLHAGLDRDSFLKYLLAELRTSPGRIVFDFGVHGGIIKDYYEAEVNVRLHYSVNVIPDDETEFPIYFQGYQEMTFYVSIHFGDVDFWMVDDFVTVSGKEKLFGGEDFDITISDGFFPDYVNFPSNGLVRLNGMLHLPLLDEGQHLIATFGLDVGDLRGHARAWGLPESYLYDWDMTNMQGWYVNVDLNLPVDEDPKNFMIPKLLPMGVDTVNVNTRFVVTDENDRRVGLKGYNFTFPAEKYSNMRYCSDLFSADVDGLWLLRVENPSNAPFELLDVRQIGRASCRERV